MQILFTLMWCSTTMPQAQHSFKWFVQADHCSAVQLGERCHYSECGQWTCMLQILSHFEVDFKHIFRHTHWKNEIKESMHFQKCMCACSYEAIMVHASTNTRLCCNKQSKSMGLRTRIMFSTCNSHVCLSQSYYNSSVYVIQRHVYITLIL